MVGPTSEFSLFFHVRAGKEREIREAVSELQRSPGYRPGDYDVPIRSIHEARFVLFDGDTRLVFATSFDGPWDAYMEDFASKPLKLFDSIFRHVEGYEGLPDLAAVKRFILGAQVTAAGYARNYGGTVKEIRRADRRHHRSVRVSKSRAARASGPRPQHAPVRTCFGAVLRRPALPVPPAAPDPQRPRRRGALRARGRGHRHRLRVLDARAGGRRRTALHVHPPRWRD